MRGIKYVLSAGAVVSVILYIILQRFADVRVSLFWSGIAGLITSAVFVAWALCPNRKSEMGFMRTLPFLLIVAPGMVALNLTKATQQSGAEYTITTGAVLRFWGILGISVLWLLATPLFVLGVYIMAVEGWGFERKGAKGHWTYGLLYVLVAVGLVFLLTYHCIVGWD